MHDFGRNNLLIASHMRILVRDCPRLIMHEGSASRARLGTDLGSKKSHTRRHDEKVVSTDQLYQDSQGR